MADIAISNDDSVNGAELLECARYGEVANVTLLLSASNIDVNHTDAHGNTALHRACANSHIECVRLLLAAGARHLENTSGNYPLHWAVQNEQKEVVQLLLGAYPNIDVLCRNGFGKGALTEAFATSNTEILNLLLEHESASEEAMMASTPTPSENAANNDEEPQQQSVTHDFRFSSASRDVAVHARELAIVQPDTPFGEANAAEDDTTGLSIWSASLVLARWLVDLGERSPEQFSGKSCCELGAGCGVPGIAVLTHTAASEVVLTDFRRETLENLRHNLRINGHEATGGEEEEATAAAVAAGTVGEEQKGENSGSAATRAVVKGVDWADEASFPGAVDVLVGSDLVYSSAIVPLLVRAVDGIAAANSKFLYVAPDTGRDGMEELVYALAAVGFNCANVQEAPTKFTANPLASGSEEEALLHFNELPCTTFMCYEFVRGEVESMPEL